MGRKEEILTELKSDRAGQRRGSGRKRERGWGREGEGERECARTQWGNLG